MDIKKYEVLLKAVDRGSINNVSYDLGYTHSGISKMLASMEAEMGFPIIKRSNKGISLTAEGERLLPIIRNLVNENEKLEEEIALINGLEKGSIRIGSFPTIAYVWIPEILKTFSQTYPGIQVEVMEENSIEILEQWLNQGIIDIGGFSRQPNQSFDWFCEREDEYVALLPQDHPLDAWEVIPLEELFKERVILFQSHKGMDQDIIQLVKYIDVKQYAGGYTCNSDLTAIRMVEQNGFVTLLPRIIAEAAVSQFYVDYRPVDRKVIRTIGFAVKSREGISPSVKKFIAAVKELW